MRYCDVTWSSPEENLAFDEALLDACDEGACPELLRVWEPPRYFVVLGYANRISTEVHLDFCQRNMIPVLRRCSGGGAVLQGPGCLNFSLVLKTNGSTELQSIPGTNQFILRKNQHALSTLLQARVEVQGHTDLAIGGLKFCGSAQRRKKHALLFHGCFLLHLDISMVEKTLPPPSRQPDYRANRTHSDFLMNAKVRVDILKGALARAWDAAEALEQLPFDQMMALARAKYGREEWNLRF
jgi:lipoate-protein ligase A